MSALFAVTAVVEAATGLVLPGLPAAVLGLLFGSGPVGPETALIARLAGAALLALSVAAWLGRRDPGGPARLGILVGVFLYNVGALLLLALAGLVLHMVGLLLWPAVLYHLALTAWGAAHLRRARPEPR